MVFSMMNISSRKKGTREKKVPGYFLFDWQNNRSKRIKFLDLANFLVAIINLTIKFQNNYDRIYWLYFNYYFYCCGI